MKSKCIVQLNNESYPNKKCKFVTLEEYKTLPPSKTTKIINDLSTL